ncbi:GNAT family N-acetyltransferase [Psychrobacillus lasiicapitis]|uniref:GNAT family N-acetyltransferase n=1 Tax=Psychrobacillus lasiicapitis TaxID=1636719 RepID=A0A544SWP3_9BACI|nr:GNAT family N-acetyltransferase [Psychrobacillus lasiicapitis]TQR09618.1 GNAT family N-acetyltransferase [Psychrobacillus lasiicapitis]GGA28973.1 N-acetyltransferase [Psychrobacillus lasiicapitis]
MFSNNCDNLEIKIATGRDTFKIIEMLKQLAVWMKDNEIDQWRFLLEGGDDDEIEQAINNQETYTVLKDDQLVATFTLLSTQSEWDKHIWGEELNSSSLYLHRFAVIPSYMKKELGSSILSWIQNSMNGHKEYIKLDCVSDNPKLNAFYKKNNFELIGLKDGHHKYQKRIK